MGGVRNDAAQPAGTRDTAVLTDCGIQALQLNSVEMT